MYQDDIKFSAMFLDTSFLVYIILLFGFIYYYQELLEVSILAQLRCQLFCINCSLFIRSWLLHRKLSKDLRRVGIQPPEFKFTKVQDRI